MNEIIIRDANVHDGEQILELINFYASKGHVLPKTLYRIYSHIDNFIVAEKDGEIIGCASVMVLWKDMAELRSLAVKENFFGKGIGRRLVEKSIEKAKQLKIPNLIALTYQDDFFIKMGFKFFDKNNYHRKLLVDCLDCPKLECCDENGYIMEIQ